MDRAGGHGGGRGNIEKVINALNAMGRRESPHIIFVAQPARSPDLNALDLGAWNSLATGIRPIQSSNHDIDGVEQQLSDRIISHVRNRWNSWNAMTTLQNIFDTKQRIIHEVFKHDGTNEYEIPRSKKSHKNVTAPSLPTDPILSDSDDDDN